MTDTAAAIPADLSFEDALKRLETIVSRLESGQAPLERSIRRVALLELLHPDAVPGRSAIPPEGAIDEAVETAKVYCGTDAPAFVNGILGAALRERAAA